MAVEKKVTQLTELTDPAMDDLLYIVDDVTGTPTGKKITRKNLLGYTEYVALLRQSGTNAPTATVIKNDTGATVTYSFLSGGAYKATFSSAVLTADKTVALITNDTYVRQYGARVMSTTEVNIYSANSAGTPGNDYLYDTPFIVRIYS